MSIFGTRPEAIKMAPLVNELKKQSAYFESTVTVTAQHRKMLDQVLEEFDIQPDYDLNVMKNKQILSEITKNVLRGLNKVMKDEKPDLVLVHGDTSTTFAASLTAFYNQIKVGHVAAGLRTWNKWSPYPEEINRQLTGVIADLHLDRKSTRLNSSHVATSYAVFCSKKKQTAHVRTPVTRQRRLPPAARAKTRSL